MKNLLIITDLKGNEYVLQGFVVGGDYLIPYYGSEYWEHFHVDKSLWIPMDKVDYSQFNYTKEQYAEYKEESDKIYKEILAKYHASF